MLLLFVTEKKSDESFVRRAQPGCGLRTQQIHCWYNATGRFTFPPLVSVPHLACWLAPVTASMHFVGDGVEEKGAS